MRRIAQIKYSTQQSTSLTQSNQIVNRFWAKMAAIYPSTWSRQFKSEKQMKLAMAEWGSELEKLSVESIKKGLERTKERESAFPPSLPEFLLLCRNNQKGLRQDTAAYKIKPKSLPYKPNKEKGSEAIESLKKILNDS